ncbi:MAG TPA: MaoC/PaaZ C-terminal domain-containing protein [Syntrophorhabdaceae bacterium]
MALIPREMMFDDIHEGDEFLTEDRTVREADVVEFAHLSGDNHPEHLDEAYGKASIYGERIAHGLLITSMVTGQVNQTGLLERLTIGVMDMNIKFLKAVKFNDTIRTVARITGKRITRNPERGIIKIGVVVSNQHNEQVLGAEWTVLVKVIPSQKS